jgi:hypothetical protein
LGTPVFGDQITPLAERYGVNLGTDEGPGDHALVIDRGTGQAYFAPKTEARAMVTRQNLPLPVQTPVFMTA